MAELAAGDVQLVFGFVARLLQLADPPLERLALALLGAALLRRFVLSLLPLRAKPIMSVTNAPVVQMRTDSKGNSRMPAAGNEPPRRRMPLDLNWSEATNRDRSNRAPYCRVATAARRRLRAGFPPSPAESRREGRVTDLGAQPERKPQWAPALRIDVIGGVYKANPAREGRANRGRRLAKTRGKPPRCPSGQVGRDAQSRRSCCAALPDPPAAAGKLQLTGKVCQSRASSSDDISSVATRTTQGG